MKIGAILGLAALTGLGAVSCGDDGDSSAPGKSTGGTTDVQSGVDSSKMVKSLTDDELKEVTDAYARALSSGDFIDAMCSFSGLFVELAAAAAPAGSDVPTCEEAVAQCKSDARSNPDATMDDGMVPALPPDTSSLADCDVTVGELEACLSASLSVLTDVFGAISCDSDVSMLDATATTPDTLVECEAVNAKCSAALGN